MNRKLTNLIVMILASLGGIDAVVLTIRHFLPSIPLGCSLGPGGCEGVLKGQYSSFGPIPTAAFGAAMYGLLIFLGLRRKQEIERVELRHREAAIEYASRADSEGTTEGISPVAVDRTRLRQLDAGVFFLAASGCLISVWLQYTALFLIKSFCPYCFFSACMVSLIALVSARDFFLADRSLNGEQKLTLGVVCGVAALGLLLYAPDIYGQYLMTQKGVTVFTPFTPRETLLPADLKIRGRADAPVLIIEFGDYQCTHCKDGSEALDQFMKDHPDRVKTAFRNFPLKMHHWAEESAQAAEAAALQGKFWEYHDLIFKNQAMLESPDFTSKMYEEFARQLGLDLKKFAQDKESPAVTAKVQEDLSVARQNQIDTAPTFFLITPKRVWRAVGKSELLTVFDNPKHDVWKAAGLVKEAKDESK